MRIINLVVIISGYVDRIESFGIYEEQLSQDVVEQAEKRFIQIAKELGYKPESEYEEDDEDTIIENGYYENPCNWNSVSFVWSDI